MRISFVLALVVALGATTACGPNIREAYNELSLEQVHLDFCEGYPPAVVETCGCPSPSQRNLERRIAALNLNDQARTDVARCMDAELDVRAMTVYSGSAEFEGCISESRELDPAMRDTIIQTIENTGDDSAPEEEIWLSCYDCQLTNECGDTFTSTGDLAAAPVEVLQQLGFGEMDPTMLLQQVQSGDTGSLFDMAGEFLSGGATDPMAMLNQLLGAPPDQQSQSCSSGEAQQCVVLGLRQLQGDGVPQDHMGAFENFDMGCTFGEGRGCLLAGNMLEYGAGMDSDPAQALEYYGRACTLGVAEGMPMRVTILAAIAALFVVGCGGGQGGENGDIIGQALGVEETERIGSCEGFPPAVENTCGCPAPVERNLERRLAALDLNNQARSEIERCAEGHLGINVVGRQIGNADFRACISQTIELDPVLRDTIDGILDSVDEDSATEQGIWERCYENALGVTSEPVPEDEPDSPGESDSAEPML